MHKNSEYLFETQNLGFRNWSDSDLDALHKINSDSEVMKYFPSVYSREQSADFLSRMQEHFERTGYCYFAVEHIHSEELIGFIGMMTQTFEAPFTPCVDIGWRLNKKYWGKGYATEGASACLNYAFEDLSIEKIYSIAPIINYNSIRVMEKIGMKKLGEFLHPKLNDHVNLQKCAYYIKENEWKQ